MTTIKLDGNRKKIKLTQTGKRGPQGIAATITIGETTTVAPNVPSEVTNVGTPQDAILDFKLTKGDKGDKGDQGDQGVNTWGSITGNLEDQTDLQTALDTGLQDAKDYTDLLDGELATVAKTGSYEDLSDKPDVPGLAPVQSVNGRTGEVIGLAEKQYVDDADQALTVEINMKEPALGLGSVGQYYRGDKTWQPLNKATVSLGNADNTSDLNKPISNATQVALNAKADLVDGKVPESQLPSFVDDVLSYDNLAAFPVTGEDGKIYIAKDTNLTYRWTGTAYTEISASLALGETSSTAYRGDRGKTAYDHTLLTDNPHATTKAQVGLGNADNTSDANKPISTATQSALDAKATRLTVAQYQVPIRTLAGTGEPNTGFVATETQTNNTLVYRSSSNGRFFIAAPVDPTNPTTKTYVDAADATKVGLSGDETIGGRKTFTLLPILQSDPAASTHAVRKQYLDDQITALTSTISSTYVKLIGGNMTGDLTTTGALVATGTYNATPTVAGVYLGMPATLNPRFTIVPTSGNVRAIDNGSGALRFINSTAGTIQLVSSSDGMFTFGSGNSPTHTVTLGSTSTGFSAYNTADQTTNYERVRMFWNSGVYSILNEISGTGIARSIRIGVYSGGLFVHSSSTLTQGFIRADQGLVNASQSVFSVNGTMTVASGAQIGQVIAPVVNQSGTASYTALLINPTETATGSGAKTLIEAQIGGVSKFKVDNLGNITANNIVNSTTTKNITVSLDAPISPVSGDIWIEA